MSFNFRTDEIRANLWTGPDGQTYRGRKTQS